MVRTPTLPPPPPTFVGAIIGLAPGMWISSTNRGTKSRINYDHAEVLIFNLKDVDDRESHTSIYRNVFNTILKHQYYQFLNL